MIVLAFCSAVLYRTSLQCFAVRFADTPVCDDSTPPTPSKMVISASKLLFSAHAPGPPPPCPGVLPPSTRRVGFCSREEQKSRSFEEPDSTHSLTSSSVVITGAMTWAEACSAQSNRSYSMFQQANSGGCLFAVRPRRPFALNKSDPSISRQISIAPLNVHGCAAHAACRLFLSLWQRCTAACGG